MSDTQAVKPKPESSGSGSFPGYKLEARVENFIPHRPVVIKVEHYGDVVLDKEWREISAFKAPPGMGVPVENREAEHFVYSYGSAMALAWTMVAQHPGSSILVRLVPYRIRYTHETHRNGEPEVIGFGKWYDQELKEVGEKLEEREEKAKEKAP